MASSTWLPSSSDEYKLCHPIGKGATADVWFAICIPINLPVAIKIIDLDRCPSSLEEIRVCKKKIKQNQT